VQEADDGREHLAAFQPSLVVEGAQWQKWSRYFEVTFKL
jgi:hypothetical protein